MKNTDLEQVRHSVIGCRSKCKVDVGELNWKAAYAVSEFVTPHTG